MNKTTKRIMVSLLVASMLSMNYVPVFATLVPETMSVQDLEDVKIKNAKEKLDKVILDVKKKIDVSDFHNVFSSDIYLDDGIVYYSLRWDSSFSKEELAKKINISIDELETIIFKCENDKSLTSFEEEIVNNLENKIFRLNVVVDEEGTIINVDRNYEVLRSENKIWGLKQIAKYSDEELIDISYKFLDKVLEKNILEKFRKDKIEIQNSYENNYLIKIPQYDKYKQIEIEDQYIVLEINNNGEVISYVLVYNKSLSFEEDFVDVPFSHNQIYNFFAENNGVKLKYKSFYNEEKEKDEFIPVYEIDHNVYINAKKGNIEKVSRGGFRLYNNSSKNESVTYDSAMGAEEEVFLTPEEIQEITQYSNLLSVDKVVENLRETNVLFNNGVYEINNFYYESIKTDNDSDYILRIDFNKIENDNRVGSVNVNVNALTGEIYYINSYDHRNEDDIIVVEYDPIIVENKVEGFLKNYNNKFIEYKLETTTRDYKTNTIEFKYTRFINGIICPEDYININFDYENNNILSYSKKYSDYEIININSEFNNIKNVLNKMDSDKILSLKFIVGTDLNDDEKVKKSFFVFKVVDGDERYYLSAVDGEYLNRYGDKISEIEKKDFDIIYSNISNNFSDILKELYKLDIYLNKENINLEENITLKDFEDLLNKTYVYEQSRVKTEKDNEFIKREDMAQMLVEKFTYYSDISKLIGIFKTDYLDEYDITEDKIGYVAIANKLGFIENDINFRPLDNLTYGEAFEIIYNIIK